MKVLRLEQDVEDQLMMLSPSTSQRLREQLAAASYGAMEVEPKVDAAVQSSLKVTSSCSSS